MAKRLEEELKGLFWPKYCNIKKYCEINAALRATGLNDFYVVGAGGYRTVVAKDNHNYVLKIAACPDGFICNVNEWKRYKKANKRQRKFLAECLYKTPKSRVVVMEKVRVYSKIWRPDGNYDDYDDFIHRSKYVVGRVDDLCLSNIGVRTSGEMVILDYGEVPS